MPCISVTCLYNSLFPYISSFFLSAYGRVFISWNYSFDSFLGFVFWLCVGVGCSCSINFVILGNALRGDALGRCGIATLVLERRPLSEGNIRSSVVSSSI